MQGTGGSRSDVCLGVVVVAGRPVVGAGRRDAERRRGDVVLAVGAADAGGGRADQAAGDAVVARVGARGQIGRATCREGGLRWGGAVARTRYMAGADERE